MNSVITTRVAEIAELAPQLVERDKLLRRRRGDLDRRYGSLRSDGQPIPPELVAEQRQARADVDALQTQRTELLAELAELRTTSGLGQRQSQIKSRNAARKNGLELTREEYDEAVAALRAEQAMFDRTRDWLNGTTTQAREEASTMAAIYASCHDPLSFDSNDW